MGNTYNTEDDVIFSLDIGTRTVIGIVGVCEDEKLKILASDSMEHEERAMHDGQIHNINSVVKVARKVKESLEDQTGLKLNKVAIAAAGRTLEVQRTNITLDIDINREIDIRTIKSAELEAVQEAEEALKKRLNVEDSKYYCVGYTVANYFLDDIKIENLEGHKGEKITVDVISTFLPHTVVDSLNTVMDRLELEVINMTLEPIAAINIAVKKDLRLLNIALVDIGAGTSDIAITKDGTISSYAMVDMAGDEITEKILKTYLLDYNTAEKLKLELNNEENHEFNDIVGISYKLSTEEILEKIDDSIEILADKISKKILELNETSPSVVFLIGGGSQIPNLTKYISQKLELPEERIVIKDTSLIENVTGISDLIKGPNAITPIGIASIAMQRFNKDFIVVTINNEKIRLFNTENSRVTDALLATEFNPRKLISRRGEDIRYYLNGIEKRILGQAGEPAQIFVNETLTDLDHKLKSGDNIVIKEAVSGENAKANIYSVVDINKKIYINGKPQYLILKVLLNDKTLENDCDLKSGDIVEYSEIKTLYELLSHLNYDINKVNCYKNGGKIESEYILQDGDKLTIEQQSSEKAQSNNKSIKLNINGSDKIINYDKEEFQFIDLFNHIEFDLNEPKGNLVLEINGEKAQYTQILSNGDIVKIYWEN